MEYGKHTGLKHTAIFGGVSQFKQERVLRPGVDILVATPGRLIDLMNQKIINLKDVQYFVLDEADRMLDMGFSPDIHKILKQIPQERQSLFFSATMPPDIRKLANEILANPESVEVAPVSSTTDLVQQSVYFTDKADKNDLVLNIIKNKKIDHVLIFTRTKYGADKLAKRLTFDGVRALAIHGDKSQNARQRALSEFKARKISALVATDIAARGIDIDKLSHVINYEIPNEAESYVHRIGRSGRAGEEGAAISLCDGSELGFLMDINRLIKSDITVVEDHPFHPQDMGKFKATAKKGKPRRGGGGFRGGRGGGSRGGYRGGGRGANANASKGGNRGRNRDRSQSSHGGSSGRPGSGGSRSKGHGTRSSGSKQ